MKYPPPLDRQKMKKKEFIPFDGKGIEGWCNSMTEKGICFMCGKMFGRKKGCKCGTTSCCKSTSKVASKAAQPQRQLKGKS